MNQQIPIWLTFLMLIVVGFAWALGDRLVEAVWPRKAG